MNQCHRSFRPEMDVFDCRYYKINKFFLSCHGQWVYQTAKNKLMGRTFLFCSVTITLFLQFRFLLAVWGNDVDATLECLSPIILMIMCFCQLTLYTIKENKLLLLVNCIKNDWKSWSSRLESKILHEYAESGRNFTLVYAGYIYSTVITFICMSLIPMTLDFLIPLNETRPKQMVYPILFPFDHNEHFNWILVHGTLTALIHLSIFFSSEAMFAVVSRHGCGLFAITSYRLKNVLKIVNSKKHSLEQSKKDCLYKEMTFIIQYHNYAIRYSNILESLYSPFFFFTIGGNTVITSVLLIQVVNSLGNFTNTIKFGSFTMATIFHTFVISLPAQKLIDQSFEIANAAYSISWYDMPEKSKKLLTMITMQAHRPCKLTASKICIINMFTFSKIIKSSLSYFTMLSSLQ